MNGRQLFDRAYARVVRAIDVAFDPNHADEVFGALTRAGIEASVYDEAASRLIATERYLPRPAQWVDIARGVKAEADQAQLRRREAEADRARTERTFHCLACRDIGLAAYVCAPDRLCKWCEEAGRASCGLPYRRQCSCKPTNPVFQSNLAKKQEAARGVKSAAQSNRGRREDAA